MDEVIKQAALDEFEETLTIVNLLLSIRLDQVQIEFRLARLKDRHNTTFTHKISQIAPQKWFMRKAVYVREANHARKQQVDVLKLDWVVQPSEVKMLRAEHQLKKVFHNGPVPEELEQHDIDVFRHIFQKRHR